MDRGLSLSTFIALLIPVLLLATGLVVDGGAHTHAVSRAESAATEAARSGADAAAGEQLLGRDGGSAALAAARRTLRLQGVPGEVWLAGGEVRVRTHTHADTTFLSIVGIRRLDAHGAASARLQPAS